MSNLKVRLYRVIKESLCTCWLQYRKLQLMFKVSPASLQTFIDTLNTVLEDRVQYSTVHIPNGHLQLINCVYCNCQVHRDFLIALYMDGLFFESPVQISSYPEDFLRDIIIFSISLVVCSQFTLGYGA